MKGVIIIKEEDLFNYAFLSELVPEDKKRFIEENKTLKDVLEFYKELKANSENKPDDVLRKSIADKIPAYSLSNVIYLYPLKNPINQNRKFRLAADTKELKPKTATHTFVDNEKEYMIKILNTENKTKVFVFSTKNEVLKNFDLIVEPQNKKYHLEDNSEPLEIDEISKVESIKLEFI